NDVLLLAGRFLESNRARLGLRSLRLSAAAEAALCRYRWPGNVRELEHVLSRAALKAVSRGADRRNIVTLEPDMLDLDADALAANDRTPAPPRETAAPPIAPLHEIVASAQRDTIRQALLHHRHNWAAAARTLELDPSNLHKLARRLGLK
ncbi:MAG: nitric oxide reductase transcription regulator, partial [Gammaproteobacteria bacterium]|nr:nitric oxide reductase transcription regulator [Gammaproteobacteria bacterium]